MSKTVDVLLLADRDGKSLWPLTESMPPCLLPIGGKPLILHALEALATCVTADVTVVVATEDDLTGAMLAEVGFPTLNISVSSIPRPFVEADTLIIRGDIVISPQAIEEMIMELEDDSGLTRAAPIVGVWRLAAGERVPTWRQAAALSGYDDRTLPHLAAYWRLATSLANSDFSDVNPAGWLSIDGMRVGMDARVLTRRAAGEGVSIGARAFVDRNVQLGDYAIIGDRAYVSKGARITRSVVMPDTFVGANLVLDQAIASGSWLCQIDTGAIERISDQTRLGRLVA